MAKTAKQKEYLKLVHEKKFVEKKIRKLKHTSKICDDCMLESDWDDNFLSSPVSEDYSSDFFAQSWRRES